MSNETEITQEQLTPQFLTKEFLVLWMNNSMMDIVLDAAAPMLLSAACQSRPELNDPARWAPGMAKPSSSSDAPDPGKYALMQTERKYLDIHELFSTECVQLIIDELAAILEAVIAQHKPVYGSMRMSIALHTAAFYDAEWRLFYLVERK